MKMPITEALTIAVIGICVVMMILAIIAVLIILLSKIIRAIESLIAKKTSATPEVAVAQPAPVAAATDREVELIGTDEKTAAVIMAIVSQQSEIPLERLSFKSIKLMDNDEKGGNK